MTHLAGCHFFEPTGSCDETLVDAARRHPGAVSFFLKRAMFCGGVAGATVCSLCSVFLGARWSRCADCRQPLRWWVLVHSVLQALQLPMRVAFFRRLRHAAREGGEGATEICVAAFTSSCCWRMSRRVSLVAYAWFVLGVVWVVSARGCEVCPNLYRLTVGVIAYAVAHAVVAVACFRHMVPLVDLTGNIVDRLLDTTTSEAASPAEIDQLPLVSFSSGILGEQQSSCAVCLSEYETEDVLRRFPCGHYFHRGCADTWLARSRRCPLCNGAIRLPSSYADGSVETPQEELLDDISIPDLASSTQSEASDPPSDQELAQETWPRQRLGFEAR